MKEQLPCELVEEMKALHALMRERNRLQREIRVNEKAVLEAAKRKMQP